MSNRKDSKMLGIQRKSAKLANIVSVAVLSVGFTATSALSASTGGRPAPESAANKQPDFLICIATHPARTLGILDTPLQAWCLSPVEVHPMTVAISRARGVQAICQTERSPGRYRSASCPSR